MAARDTAAPDTAAPDTAAPDTAVRGTVALQTLDAAAIRRWCRLTSDALAVRRDQIDALNVYPVPDGDTGTNLASTVRAAADQVDDESSTDAGVVLLAMAHGSVLGARGNSGVILAQILRGLAESAAGAHLWTADGVRAGLLLASKQAYAAVALPVEGTILSVLRVAAGSASEAGHELSEVVAAALTGASGALARTTGQLAPLAEAGVVDAGGLGLLVVLDALHMVVSGQPSTLPPAAPVSPLRAEPSPAPWHAARPSPIRATAEVTPGCAVGGFEYEVQYLLRADEAALEVLKRKLSDLGDSLAVVGTGHGEWNVHVHVDDVGAAIEAGVEAGQPYRITVVRFEDQLDPGSSPTADGGPAAGTRQVPRNAPATGVAIVAIAPGAGLADVFRREGVHVLEGHVLEGHVPEGHVPEGHAPEGHVPDGQVGGPVTLEASIQDVVDAILATGAGSVILLPNAAQIGGVARQAAQQARAAGVAVAVIPTRSAVQGLAAVAVHEPTRRFEDDVIAMAESAAGTRWAEITVAAREALTMAGRCQPGDVLGLIDGEVVEIGTDVVTLAQSIIDRLLGVGGELVTVLIGVDAPPGAGDAIARHVAGSAAHVEVSVLAGGQPDSPLLIGVE